MLNMFDLKRERDIEESVLKAYLNTGSRKNEGLGAWHGQGVPAREKVCSQEGGGGT